MSCMDRCGRNRWRRGERTVRRMKKEKVRDKDLDCT